MMSQPPLCAAAFPAPTRIMSAAKSLRASRYFVSRLTPRPPPSAPVRGGNPVSPTSPLRGAACAPRRRVLSGEPADSPEPPQRGLTSSCRHLVTEETRERAACVEELRRLAGLDDPARLKNDGAVGELHRREALRRDEDGAARERGAEALDETAL